MKKLLLVLLVALVVFVTGIYLFIPSNLTISSATTVKTTDNGVERFVMDESKWALWWHYKNPYEATYLKAPATFFNTNGDDFSMGDKFYKSVAIHIKHHDKQLESKLLVVRLALDSTGIEWKCIMEAGSNPFSRFSNYLQAKQIKQNMDEVLANLKGFLSKDDNVYGIPIERNYLKDTLYVTAKTVVTAYPSTQTIYELIKKIKAYITANGGNQTGSPIFHVTDFGNHQLQLMAGVPTDKNMAEKDGFNVKHMVRGSFMITEVVGGDYSIDKASKILQQYFSDYHKTSMAMNFTMLVTDRILQPDSSKWITKLYQPVY